MAPPTNSERQERKSRPRQLLEKTAKAIKTSSDLVRRRQTGVIEAEAKLDSAIVQFAVVAARSYLEEHSGDPNDPGQLAPLVAMYYEIIKDERESQA